MERLYMSVVASRLTDSFETESDDFSHLVKNIPFHVKNLARHLSFLFLRERPESLSCLFGVMFGRDDRLPWCVTKTDRLFYVSSLVRISVRLQRRLPVHIVHTSLHKDVRLNPPSTRSASHSHLQRTRRVFLLLHQRQAIDRWSRMGPVEEYLLRQPLPLLSKRGFLWTYPLKSNDAFFAPSL